jgi:large subunit ribosomal protein L10
MENNSSEALLNMIYGYNSVVFAPNNPNIFAKEISNFSKELGIEIKFGVLNDNLIDRNMILDLANIDSKEVLILRLIYILNGNIGNLVNSLNYSVVSFLNVLNSIKNVKEEGVK